MEKEVFRPHQMVQEPERRVDHVTGARGDLRAAARTGEIVADVAVVPLAPRAVVDGAPPGDDTPRLAGSRPATLGAPAWQEFPQLLGLLSQAVDEGVDGFEGDGTEPALLALPQLASDLLRRPALQQALAHEPAEPLVALEVMH